MIWMSYLKFVMFNGTFQFWFLTRFMPDWHTELFQLHSDFQFLCCDSSVLIWFDFPPVECAYFAICLLCHILIDKRITINQDVFCSMHIWNPPPGTPKRREVLATNHIINDYAEWCILFFVKLVHFFQYLILDWHGDETDSIRCFEFTYNVSDCHC